MRVLWAIFVVILLPPIALAQGQRPADCAAPRGAILPGNQAIQYCDALSAQVHEMRAALELIQHNLRNGHYSGQQGPAGPQGPPGPAGRPGPAGQSAAVDLQPLLDRVQRSERWLTAVEARIDNEIQRLAAELRAEMRLAEVFDAKPPDQGLETQHVTGQSAPALPPGRQGPTTWIEDVLRPIASVVGTAYAGPVGGALATSVLGGVFWLVGRKKKVNSSR